MTPNPILGIPGSSRSDSYNVLLLKSLSQLLPDSFPLDIAMLDKSLPSLKKYSAVVFSTPEYNFSYPQVLHEAISKAGDIWAGKPFAIIGASLDTYGTAKAIRHLQEDMQAKNMEFLPIAPVSLTSIASKFDSQGNLIDAAAKKQLAQFAKELTSHLHH